MDELSRLRGNLPIQPQEIKPQSGNKNVSKPAGKSFDELLADAEGRNVKFSNHAAKRLETRKIQLSEDNLTRLDSAIDEAQTKGSKESLVLMDDLAFIVNVRDRLVVTAVDVAEKGGGTFTQIDSVVIAQQNKK